MKQFLGVLPLNLGVNLLVAINFTTNLSSLLINLPGLDVSLPLPWILCLICNLYSMVTWIIAYYGSYKGSVAIVRGALIMWIIYTIVWVILSILAMTDFFESDLCVCKRCPESLWLFANTWHTTCEIHIIKSISRNLKLLRDVTEHARPEAVLQGGNFNHGFDYVILCLVIVLTNFVLGIITLASYLKELKCYVDYCSPISTVSATLLPEVSNHNSRHRIKVLKTVNHNTICSPAPTKIQKECEI